MPVGYNEYSFISHLIVYNRIVVSHHIVLWFNNYIWSPFRFEEDGTVVVSLRLFFCCCSLRLSCKDERLVESFPLLRYPLDNTLSIKNLLRIPTINYDTLCFASTFDN